MDSRNQTPLAWFLFFQPENVLNLEEGQGVHADLYLVSDWEPARERFLERVPLLLRWFPGQLSQSDVEVFLERLGTLIGGSNEKFLVLDATELPFFDDNVPLVRKHLENLESLSLNDRQKLEQIDVWSCSRWSDDEEERWYKVFGYYYGGYFES